MLVAPKMRLRQGKAEYLSIGLEILGGGLVIKVALPMSWFSPMRPRLLAKILVNHS